MKKISIKREQSQAGLSFAEREKFRPQVKISIKREQSQAGLSFAERLRVLAGASEQVLGRAKRQSRARAGEPCSGMRENRRSLAGGESTEIFL